MIDEIIMDKVIPLPDEDEEMESIQRELEDEDFPVTNFKKGGVFYHLTRLSVKLYIELKELAREILNACFIRHAEGDWLEIKAADYSKTRKAATKTKGYITIYRSDYETALQVKRGHGFKTEADASGNVLKFYAYEDSVIAADEEIGKVLVEAEQEGSHYNLQVNKITTSMIHLEGVERVTNEEDWLKEDGTEIEEIESLRERCISSWAELSTRTIKEKLINAAKSVSGVLYADVDDQHPRGQATVDIIITGISGEASDALLLQVTEAIEPLKGSYEDYLVKSSEIIKQDFEIVVYLSKHSATDGVADQAVGLLQNMMRLTRGDLNTLYRDSIIRVLSSNIVNYLKSDIIQPSEDQLYEKNQVIIAGEIDVTVVNI